MTAMKIASFLVAWCLLLIAALVPGPLRGADIALAQENGITVRVLLFSGRPDPAYELKDTQMIEKLKGRIAEAKRLDRFEKETVIPANIGYKGILIVNPGRKGGLPSRFAVYKGTMEVMDDQKRFLEDRGGEIEKMLLDEAIRRNLIDEVILRRMKKAQ